jgi:hypothetical protein
LLTGVPVGQRDESGQFLEGTVHARVEARLREWAVKIERFGKESESPKNVT